MLKTKLFLERMIEKTHSKQERKEKKKKKKNVSYF